MQTLTCRLLHAERTFQTVIDTQPLGLNWRIVHYQIIARAVQDSDVPNHPRNIKRVDYAI